MALETVRAVFPDGTAEVISTALRRAQELGLEMVVVKNHAIRFLQEGNRVKAVVQFRGREMAHTDLGRRVLLSIQ
jgi:translation initiation factor IF-3